MRDDVSHRGPDGFGTALFAQGSELASGSAKEKGWNVALAHRRLSIIDLTAAGRQPMEYGHRYWITYNGEVYNYVELRRELQKVGHRFRSNSDTEVVLAAYAEWGTACFQRFRGMWGLSIYDAQKQEAIICRDRLGIKPVYIWTKANVIAIASEIKQFRSLPGFVSRVDHESAGEFLETGYEDPKRTLFRDVITLPAGNWVRVDISHMTLGTPEPYWFPERVQAVSAGIDEASIAFSRRFSESMSLHLRSDVPIGCALSGGLDSSSIAVIANELTSAFGAGPLQTFTSTFPGEGLDEREYVDAVLAKIRHQAHFDTPNPEMFLSDLDRLIWMHDEPVSNASVYASYCIARLARKSHVPVILSGQGGDEIFGAYWPSYFLYLQRLLRRCQLHSLLRHFAGALMPSGNIQLLRQVPVVLRRYRARRRPPVTVQLKYEWDRTVPTANILDAFLSLPDRSRRIFEMRTMFLPRLLKWDDRNSMAFSVEGRYPFLDHELIELVLSFRDDLLYNNGWTKLPLRYGLSDRLPRKISLRQSKIGFETPQLFWIKGSLRPCLRAWLLADRPIWQLVDRTHVVRLAQKIWEAKDTSDEAGQQLFRLFTFDRWLQIFEVSTEI